MAGSGANPESIITKSEILGMAEKIFGRRWLWIPDLPLRGNPE
jgi:hypothetical protein